MTERRIVVALATLCAAALCVREGAAQSHADAQAAVAARSGERVLQSFARCRTIASPAARLDCFDNAAGALEAAVKAKDLRIVDRQDIRTARRSLFGFTLPRIALFGGGEDAADRKEEAAAMQIETTIVSARQVENNRVELRLAEGDAVWRTTDPMNFPPRAGKKIRIRAGALGNYFLNIEGERTVRGMRLR